MKDMEILFVLTAVIWLGFYIFKIWLKVKFPKTYDAMQEMDEKRMERNKKLGVGAAKMGFGLFRLLTKR